MNHWDQAYSDVEGYKYGEQPNAFLKEQAHRIPARARVLLPGDGEGRNGVWLAEQGHQVCALDNSAVGLAKAEALAHRRQVTLQIVLVDLADWQPEPASADAVVLTYLHLPPPLRTPVMHKLVQALKPGGVLLLEAFHPRQLQYSSGGPKNEAMLYTLDMLRGDLAAGMQELLGSESETLLDEGPGHQGPAYVTRWIGQKI